MFLEVPCRNRCILYEFILHFNQQFTKKSQMIVIHVIIFGSIPI